MFYNIAPTFHVHLTLQVRELLHIASHLMPTTHTLEDVISSSTLTRKFRFRDVMSLVQDQLLGRDRIRIKFHPPQPEPGLF